MMEAFPNHSHIGLTVMRMLVITLVTATISLTASAQQERGVGYPTVAKALEALKARSDVNVSVQGGWTIVDETPANALWSFTPADHPAHPAVVKRAVVTHDGVVSVNMTALCQAGKTACDKLIEEFKTMTAQMSQSMKRSAEGKTTPP